SLQAEITEATGSKVLSFEGKKCAVPAGRTTLRISQKWENPIPWELDGGHLYAAKIKLFRNGAEIDSAQPVTFGFRELWTDGRKLMLNGHEMHLRLLGWFGGGSSPVLSFYRLMGFNAAYIQANPSMWWRDWKETPVMDDGLLDAMDRSGFAVMLPSPAICYLGEKLLKDDSLRHDFERETELWIRRYRNHPSVIAWTVGMNCYCPRDSISPTGMGRRIGPERAEQGMPKAITTACEIVRKSDPTRLAYSHADGGLGDIATSNMYLNFAPLQEREEWPMSWAESGEMPYQMAEFGQPYTANFWKPIKGKSFLPTEYFSIYFGDKAYASETDAGLKNLVEYGVKNTGHGSRPDWDLYPVYWDFQRLFVRQTNRAFRTWGVNAGWAYWNLDTGYGDLPSTKKTGSWIFSRYANIKEDCLVKPPWANENFDIHSQANKPLLTYIAGHPRHTDKTHLYFGAERVEKNVAVVWDGPGTAVLEMNWILRASDGSVSAKGDLSLSANTGKINLMPISFIAPAVKERTDYDLELKTKHGGKDAEGDSFSITVFPRHAEPLKLRSKIAVWDPAGKSSAWIKALGVPVTAWDAKKGIKGVEVLVIGREALRPGEAMPYSAEDVREGLKVIILEQLPAVWRGLGFRTTEAMPRRVYAADPSCPALAGLRPGDLFDWRGSPDLLPEGKNQASDTRHAPKWTNTNAIASTVPQIPRSVGFTPILACEFDMDYSPLLEWRDGKGMVLFCSLDLSGRVGYDPAASLLARRMLEWVDSSKPAPTRRVIYRGGPKGLSLLGKLCVTPEAQFSLDRPAESLLVIGEGGDAVPATELNRFIEDGGHVFVLPQSTGRLAAMGLKTSRKSLQRCPPLSASPAFRAVGPNLLRWREAVEVDAFDAAGQAAGAQVLGDGLIARRTLGKGEIVFSQLEPSLIENLHLEDKDKAEAVKLSVFRLEQLVARIMSNLGAAPAKTAAARLCWLDLGPQVESLNHWNILGPYFVERENGEAMLAEKFPGEDMAIIGDTNPNPTFKRTDGGQLDWRPTIKADEKGLVNLGLHYKRDSLVVAYAATTVESETDREAVLRLGADWRMRVWVNGKEVFSTLSGMNKPAAYSVKIQLHKGVNTVSCKIGSGSKGFGFYADISKAMPAGAAAMADELKGISFYAGRKISEEFDPYEYFYW
ncbi:MAG: glycoside hydrolase family 2 TIM barrel-domain containing protein, partial [Victivallales bacterium]